ncbi:MAG: zinc ribbon domain-containing protein [Desulfatirhabdiaceae bacterium]
MTLYTRDSEAFTPPERRILLDEIFRLISLLDQTGINGIADPEAINRHGALRHKYREKVPVFPLSRCPFTQAIYRHSIDPYGIDGLWWDYRSPNRPLEPHGGNVAAFTGAMHLSDSLERMPFLCKPGPGVPFIVPRVLEHDSIRAVISAQPIGLHSGYIIVYFTGSESINIEGFNDWGTDYYQFESDPGRVGWNRNYVTSSDYDFELEKWISSGKLLWILPGDTSLTLREGVEDCPYIGLEGPRKIQLIQDGEVWYEEIWLDTESFEAPYSVENPNNQPEGDSGQIDTGFDSPDISCIKCGSPLPASAKFCMVCGTPVPVPNSSQMTENMCPSCGESILPNVMYCMYCGYKMI